jgi:hypothetical protein
VLVANICKTNTTVSIVLIWWERASTSLFGGREPARLLFGGREPARLLFGGTARLLISAPTFPRELHLSPREPQLYPHVTFFFLPISPCF